MPKLTIPDLAAKKAAGERLVMVAVGEVLTATWAERAGVDIVGVGDSLGMTLHGHENTLAMTVDQMIMHTQAVRRGAPNTMSLTLNTVRAIMRDVKMREQAGLIQKEVHTLLDDVGRLNDRVAKLRTHFEQADKDIEQIETSSRKITSRGEKITSLEVADDGEEAQERLLD